jgi:thiamine-monophosphate kinase
MGARPVLATVALGLPVSAQAPVDEDWVLGAYRGMVALASRFGARIAGGDLVAAPAITISVTMVGEVAASRLKRRDGGRPGDVVAVSGPLGASRAGLELVERGNAIAGTDAAAAVDAFRTPEPRVREGRWFGAARAVRAMMDCSDGLSTDLGRMARASGCGALVTAVPVHLSAASVADGMGADSVDWALSGGEDFELLVAVAPRVFPRVAAAFARRFGRPLLRVGHLTEQPGVELLGENGARRALGATGWDHFSAVSPLA